MVPKSIVEVPEIPENSNGLLLWRVSQLWELRMKRCLDPLGITLTQLSLMMTLRWMTETGANVSQKELAEFSSMDRVMVGRILKVFLQNDWIDRTCYYRYGRVYVIRLTEKGLLLLKKAIPVFVDADEGFFITGDREMDKLYGLMLRLSSENMDR